MIKVFGSKKCPDCVEMEKAYKLEGIDFEYHDITENLQDLKAFLKLRDCEKIFDAAREQAAIGIPVVQGEDGKWTFDWQDFLKDGSQSLHKSTCTDGTCSIQR